MYSIYIYIYTYLFILLLPFFLYLLHTNSNTNISYIHNNIKGTKKMKGGGLQAIAYKKFPQENNKKNI